MEKEAVPLKEGLAAWVTTSAALVEAEPKLPEALDDRAQDSWEVLLAIADMAGGEWPHWARCAAVTLSVGDAREDESLGIKLLLDIRDIFADLGDDRITTANLIKALIRLEESPWADLEGKVLNPRRLGWRLKPFSIRSGTIRLSDTVTVKGYLKEAFEPEWARYLPPLPQAKPSQAEKPSQVAGTDIDTDTDNVTVSRDVTVSQGVGKEDDNGQRLHALSLWEQLGRPAKPTLRDGIKIIDVERFIDNANAADLTAFITGLEGTA